MKNAHKTEDTHSQYEEVLRFEYEAALNQQHYKNKIKRIRRFLGVTRHKRSKRKDRYEHTN